MTRRTLATWLAAAGLGLGACAASSGPGSEGGPAASERPPSPDWRTDAARAASRAGSELGDAAEVTAAAAKSAGESAQVAAQGLRSGFAAHGAGR